MRGGSKFASTRRRIKLAPIVVQIGPARLEISRGADQTTLSNALLALDETFALPSRASPVR
jgi:hypothetical protein